MGISSAQVGLGQLVPVHCKYAVIGQVSAFRERLTAPFCIRCAGHR